MTTEELQVTVRFTTKLPEQYRIQDNPLTVPGSSKRAALSKIVNHLLNLEQSCPFDFLVEGKLLRNSLRDHFRENKLSVEGVADIEYIPVVLPPQKKTDAIHEDWIRSVSSESSTFLSASDDGTIKGWNESLEPLWSLVAHSSPIMHVTSVPNMEPMMFLTASQDHLIKAWIKEVGQPGPQEYARLIAHSDTVCSVSASPNGTLCCSVGWDEQQNIWSCGKALLEAENDPELEEKTKRRKMSAPSAETKKIGPLGQFSGHKGCISDVIWPDENTIFTCGWDHTVKKWDVETASNLDTLTSSKVVHSLTSNVKTGSSLIAFGSSDGILRLWDSRQTGDAISLKLYRSHTNWISSVKWSPKSEFHLASASYDNSVRVWDVRSTIPLGSCPSHSDKVLAVDWASEWALLSAGADCMLQIHDLNVTLNEG